jgi:hypothetical protein
MRMLPILLRQLDWKPRAFIWTWAVVALEVCGRMLGRLDHMRRRDHSIWDIAKTTKQWDHSSQPGSVVVER